MVNHLAVDAPAVNGIDRLGQPGESRVPAPTQGQPPIEGRRPDAGGIGGFFEGVTPRQGGHDAGDDEGRISTGAATPVLRLASRHHPFPSHASRSNSYLPIRHDREMADLSDELILSFTENVVP
jgi:hypothetical protein